MGGIWSDQHKYECWLRVEIAVAEAWADEGRIPREALPAIRNAQFNVERINEIEQETHHDVIAFLRSVAELMGPESRWIHLGLTSSDIIDSALALQMVESCDLLRADVDDLIARLGEKALLYRRTVMMGRTHNVHAEPMTWGYKLALWYAEMKRHRSRLQQVRAEIAIAKIGGAVGTHANVPPSVEERTATSLGLSVEPVANQVVQRDRHACYVLALSLLASSLDRMATELRNLQHTEIMEVEEPFRQGQQGSSAMPHKRNPILNERVSGLARVLRGYAIPALENVVLWHERDISNSSVERVVLPSASILTDYLIGLMTTIISDMTVREDRMAKNVEASHGLYFSEKVLTALVEGGMSRQDAYKLVQTSAMEAWGNNEMYRTVLERDVEISAKLTSSELDDIFDQSTFLRHVDTAFERVGLLPASEASGPN